MAILHIEKLGGIAGFGGGKSRIRSRGKISTTDLSRTDSEAVESLFQTGGQIEASKGVDGFRFRISRDTEAGTETIEVPEEHVPAVIMSCVKDELV
jgi:hypothetical protein